MVFLHFLCFCNLPNTYTLLILLNKIEENIFQLKDKVKNSAIQIFLNSNENENLFEKSGNSRKRA